MADLRLQSSASSIPASSASSTAPLRRLVTRVTNDVDAINEMFGSGALNAIGDLVRLVAIVQSCFRSTSR